MLLLPLLKKMSVSLVALLPPLVQKSFAGRSVGPQLSRLSMIIL